MLFPCFNLSVAFYYTLNMIQILPWPVKVFYVLTPVLLSKFTSYHWTLFTKLHLHRPLLCPHTCQALAHFRMCILLVSLSTMLFPQFFTWLAYSWLIFQVRSNVISSERSSPTTLSKSNQDWTYTHPVTSISSSLFLFSIQLSYLIIMLFLSL